jgi:hypothetical protein
LILVAKKVGTMKSAMAVLFILGATALIFAAVAVADSDSTTVSGSVRPIAGYLNIDTRSGESKLAELQRGPGSKRDSADDEGDMIVNTGSVRALPAGSSLERSKIIDLSSNNSSAQNSSVFNSTALNSTALNSTALNTSAVNASAANGSGLKSIAPTGSADVSGSTKAGSGVTSTSSQASMKGIYSMSASRHEMGKSDIKSNMALSGDFDVENSVNFQDHDF